MSKPKLDAKRWRVEVVPDIAAEMARVDGPGHDTRGERLDGYVDESRRRILLSSDQSPRALASTYFHELLHVAAPTIDEKTVRRIESTIFPALWRNGWRPAVLWRRRSDFG